MLGFPWSRIKRCEQRLIPVLLTSQFSGFEPLWLEVCFKQSLFCQPTSQTASVTGIRGHVDEAPRILPSGFLHLNIPDLNPIGDNKNTSEAN